MDAQHEPWCHKCTGCSEPGHCTCDALVLTNAETDQVVRLLDDSEPVDRLLRAMARLDETPEQRREIEDWHAAREQEA